MNRKLFKRVSMMVAVLVIATIVQVRAANIPAAVGMLPSDCNLAAAFNLQNFNQQQSLLSYFPMQEMTTELKQLAQQSSSKTGQIIPSLLDPNDPLKMHTLAFGVRIDPTNPEEVSPKFAFLGEFKKGDAFSRLSSMGVTPGPNNRTGLITSADGEEIYVQVPADGVMIFSDDLAWLDSAVATSKEKTGLTGGGSDFNKTMASLSGGNFDFIVWAQGSLVLGALETNPAMMAQLGPLAQIVNTAQGIALTTYPGAQPLMEIHTSHANEGLAQSAVQSWTQLLNMVKQMMQFAPENTPQQKAEKEQSMRAMQNLNPSAKGSNCVLSYQIDEMPPREPVKQGMLSGMMPQLRKAFE